MSDLLTLRPYMITAIHQWCCDHDAKPMIVIHAGEGTYLPPNLRYGDATTFDIGVAAIADLHIGEFVSFKARFSGKVQEIMVPVGDVYAIYAEGKEIGFVFDRETNETTNDVINTEEPPPKKKPTLTIVK